MTNFSTQMLRVRLMLHRIGVVGSLAALILCGSTAVLAYALTKSASLEQHHRTLLARAVGAGNTSAGAAPEEIANLREFYQTLGEQRYAEQQVRTLFGLAEKSGLRLTQGEYRSTYDRKSRAHAYEIVLPIRGSYNAIWDFAISALVAMPYAALNEISFKRDSIGDSNVDAHLRLTLYLRGRPQ